MTQKTPYHLPEFPDFSYSEDVYNLLTYCNAHWLLELIFKVQSKVTQIEGPFFWSCEYYVDFNFALIKCKTPKIEELFYHAIDNPDLPYPYFANQAFVFQDKHLMHIEEYCNNDSI